MTVIAGPTASGKSAYALELAAKCNGIIINADASQVYADLPILSAQPSEEDKAAVPHRLYGMIPGEEHCSAARWVELARAEIARAHDMGAHPILVGGTGLYIASLLEGIAEVPPMDAAVREEVRALVPELVRSALEQEDPVMARRLHPNDRQRNARALEVVRSSGRSLAHWQAETGPGLLPDVSLRVSLILPEREILYGRCDQRFDQMMAAGALDEVARLARRNLDPTLPVMKALGVPPLMAALEDQITLDEAIEQSELQTRQYAKRQLTWFKSGGQSRRVWLQGAEMFQ